MQAVKQLADLSARGLKSQLRQLLRLHPYSQKLFKRSAHLFCRQGGAEVRIKVGQTVTVEEEWVLVATCAAFLSKSCLSDPVRVKTRQ